MLMVCRAVMVAEFMEGRKAVALGISGGLVLGLAIGSSVFLGTRAVLKWAVRRLNLHEPNPPPLRLALAWLICIVALIGMVAAGIFVAWLTRMVSHFMQ